ncbi:MAG TPA: SLC13 family permease [Bacteroidales bacterium]|nr:SLC13 family permease [Bacteroidales bacterium]HRX97948.1 SLC13 family permease [Bacteroidales bacterium]
MKKNARFFFGLFGGLLAPLLIILFVDLDPSKPAVTYTLAIAVLMAIWWITEVVPLAVTSLLPVVLFPAFGILNGKTVSSAYFNDVIFLFLGGFLLALAMQKWNLHKRIALKILHFTGVSRGRILLGFMLATAFLSMWISNTATAMMMIPIVISVISQMEEQFGKENTRKYAIGLLLAIAYSASTGGIATLVGTPPNLAFARIFSISFPHAPEISFGQWMIFALPVSIAILMVIFIYLYFVFCKSKSEDENDINPPDFSSHYRALGPFKTEEKVILAAFLLFALLLLFRSEIQLGSIKIPGWSMLFAEPAFLNDGTIAIFIGVILFMIPSKTGKEMLLDWETARQLPWHIVILFGGGFALAEGFIASGLSEWIGNSMQSVSGFHPLLVIIILTTIMIFLTEVTSNTATAQMMLPIVGALSVSAGVHPLLFMLPVTLAGSMAFMLPVATPPNAIIFGTDRIRIADMAKAGLFLNLIGIVLVSLSVWFYGRFIFDIDLQNLPDWVNFH